MCTELFDVMMEEARKVDAVRIDSVDLVIGEARDIVEPLFDGFFKHLTRGTIAQGCRISYTRIPVIARCRQCDTAFPLDIRARGALFCPTCGHGGYSVLSGREFDIASMEVTTVDEAQAEEAPCQRAQ